MNFHQNLKRILDSLGLSNYQAAQRCGVPSQTIDNIIKKPVYKPDAKTLERLSNGLGGSKYKLMYGTDSFDYNHFVSILKKKNKRLEKVAELEKVNFQFIREHTMPPEEQQKIIAEYVGVSQKELFKPSTFAIDYFHSQNVKEYVRPDLTSEPLTDEDMIKLYSNLTPVSKRIVYNLVYDLATIETENIVTLTPREFWKKEDKTNINNKKKYNTTHKFNSSLTYQPPKY